MKILILIISLCLGFFTRPVFAEGELVYIDKIFTDEIIAGQTFPIGVQTEAAAPNTTFYYKLYGGINGNLSQIKTTPELNYNSNWSDFPTVTTDSDGNAYANTSAYIVDDSPSGEYDFYVVLAYLDSSTVPEYQSPSHIINVLQLHPTSTPTSTPKPTSTPIPTSTPTPISNSSIIPTLTPTPINPKIFGTATASAAISVTPSESFVDSGEEIINQVQAGSNPTATPSSSSSVPKKTNFIPLIILICGVLFLITPLIFSKIKFKQKCLKK